MTSIKVLAAGDEFVLTSLFADAVAKTVPGAEISTLDMPWPTTPFGDIADVQEAAGDEDLLIEALAGVQAVVTQMAPFTERVLRASPELKYIGVSRGGPVNVNIAVANELGITVANAPGRNAVATAEMTIAQIFAVVRRIPITHGSLVSRQWRGEFYRFAECGPEIGSLSIGLLGYGAVGSRVAKILVATGAEILVYDPYADAAAVAEVGSAVRTVEELFDRSNLVTVHARLTQESAFIVSAANLARMRRGSYLVNCARGGLVDYEAVYDAIESGQLAGAGFDVFPTEPLDPASRMLDLIDAGKNIVITPHIAGASQSVALRAADIVAADLGRWAAGEPIRHEVRG